MKAIKLGLVFALACAIGQAKEAAHPEMGTVIGIDLGTTYSW